MELVDTQRSHLEFLPPYALQMCIIMLVTELSELAEELASCCLVIGNDTGSMHLANMVGTEVFVLFGPTNSIKTKPFFDSIAR